MDKEFSSTSLTGCVLLASDVGLYPRKTYRAIRPPQADQPRRETTDVEQSPRPAASTNAREPLTDTR